MLPAWRCSGLVAQMTCEKVSRVYSSPWKWRPWEVECETRVKLCCRRIAGDEFLKSCTANPTVEGRSHAARAELLGRLRETQKPKTRLSRENGEQEFMSPSLKRESAVRHLAHSLCHHPVQPTTNDLRRERQYHSKLTSRILA